MFNILRLQKPGRKAAGKGVRKDRQDPQNEQVRKIMSNVDQRLILMVRG